MDLFAGLPDPQQGKGDMIETVPEIISTGTSGKIPLSAQSLAGSSIKDSLFTEAKRKINTEHDHHHGVSGKRSKDESRCAEDSVTESSLTKGLCLHFKGFRTEMQGERDDMEDHSVMMDRVTDSRITLRSDLTGVSFYGVFDGHNGKRASAFMADKFLEYFLASFAKRGGSSKDLDHATTGALQDAYKGADTAFLAKASSNKPPWKDGSTATTALIVNDKAYFANVGDSKAVLCRYDGASQKYKALTVTVDHIPTVYEERQRIQQQGGFVKDGRLNGILEVSRSLGDLPYKKNSGLTCIPSIQKCQLTNNDRFIIIACDGLWKALSPSDAMQIVLEMTENVEETQLESKYSAATARLAKEALKRLTGDNVTVIVVWIKRTS